MFHETSVKFNFHPKIFQISISIESCPIHSKIQTKTKEKTQKERKRRGKKEGKRGGLAMNPSNVLARIA